MVLALSSPLVSAYVEADFFGKLIFIGLFSLSVICWVILIQKTIQTKRIKKLSLTFAENLDKNKQNLLHFSIDESRKMVSPYIDIFASFKQKALEILQKNHFFLTKEKPENPQVYLSQSDFELLESHVLTTISTKQKQLEKNLFVLSTIVTLAPFLGLLGTVWGILLTFAGLQTGGMASSNSAILGGLSTALATTVLGLVIAIPALIAYNYLKNNLKNYHSDMEDFLYNLLSTLELQYRKPLS